MGQQVGAQQINSGIKADNVVPFAKTLGEYGKLTRSLGSEADVLPVIAGDVLDPLTTVTVKVVQRGTPERIMKSTDGVDLNGIDGTKAYKFVADAYGDFDITYVISDGAYNNTSLRFRLTVIDEQPPVITVSGKVPETASRGTVTIPMAEATDNIDKTPAVYITVFTPGFQTIYAAVAPNGKNASFTAQASGVYVMRYNAIDSMGNSAFLEYFITVS